LSVRNEASVNEEPLLQNGDRPPWSAGDLVSASVAGAVLSLAALYLFFRILDVSSIDIPGNLTVALSSMVAYSVFFATGWYVVLHRKGATFVDAGFTKVRPLVLLLMVPATFAVMFVNGVIVLGIRSLVNDVPDASDQILITETGLGPADLVVLLVATAVLVPVVEEFFFRGLIYRYIRPRRGSGWATGITSVLFAGAHFIPVLFPAFLFLGFVLARLAERYKSIYPSIVVHGLFNAAAVVTVYLTL
jgi:membrane protease YdiL (CAAX protease family)